MKTTKYQLPTLKQMLRREPNTISKFKVGQKVQVYLNDEYLFGYIRNVRWWKRYMFYRIEISIFEGKTNIIEVSHDKIGKFIPKWKWTLKKFNPFILR